MKKDRTIVIEVKPSGNVLVDGTYLYKNQIRSHLKRMKEAGFYKFIVKPYCSLVTSFQVEDTKKIVSSL